ncbi:transcriptional regulator [Oxalobacteraceae bacterium]|nr:transcriptional regulator [Oxalobacteraceae bacterium]
MPSPAKTSRPTARLIGRAAVVQAILDTPATLTWVAAPAGAGKTSLALELCHAAGDAVAWLRLDEADADPASFLMYFVQAIEQSGVAPGWQAPPLQREHLPALQSYLRLFLRSLADVLLPGSHVVMDDVHRCQDAHWFRPFLEIASAELPPSTRVLLLGRQLPPQNCARLQVHGAMEVLDGAALAFSRGETETLLKVLGVVRAEEVGDTVYNFTQGWAAGIALVANWLRRRPDAVLGAEDVLSEAVVGYLAEEVFSAYSEEEQRTLLAVCWLPYFSGAWAASLSGLADAPDIVARLAAQGGLIYEYPGRQYCLHPLFQSFLRKWAAERIAADQRREWIASCIGLLQAGDNVETAIKLALEHGLPERAASLIEACAPAMFAQARHHTLVRWIEALPEAHRGAWHDYWLGVAVFMSDTARARAALLKALAGFTAQKKPKYRFLALSSIVSSYFFDGAAEQALSGFLRDHVDLEADFQALPDTSFRAHLTHSVWSALFMTDPAHADIATWEQRALDALRQPADPTLKARLATMLVQHDYQSGRYDALHSVRVLLDALPEADPPSPYAHHLAYLPRLYDDLVSLDPARFDASYAACRRESDESGIGIMDVHYLTLHAVACLLRGDLDKAGAALAEVAAQTPARHYNFLAHLQLAQSWLAARAGDGHAALEYARLTQQAAQALDSVPHAVCAQVAICVAYALTDRGRCASETAELRAMGIRYRSRLASVHADLLQAWLELDAHGARDGRADGTANAGGIFGDVVNLVEMDGYSVPALSGMVVLGAAGAAGPASAARVPATLASALEAMAAEGQGYLALVVPQILQPLCVRALDAGVAGDAARLLIRAWRLTPPAGASESWPWPVRLHTFGNFELRLDGEPLRSQGKSKHRQLDVLKLIAAHAPASVPMERAAALLWPDADGDSARKALETTLSRLRATIGAGSIVLEQGALSLAPQLCWCDSGALEQALPALQAQLQQAELAEAPLLAAADRVVALYRGELLAGDSAPWLLARRELWRGKVARILSAAGRRLADTGRLAPAAQLLERALDADPYSKVLSANLMHILLDSGRYEEGLAAYRRYRRMALGTLGTPVAADIEALAQQLMQGAHAASPDNAAPRAAMPDGEISRVTGR